MTIKVTYNVTDVYVTQDVSPVYINVSYSGGGSGGSAVWGGITGTLSDQTDLQSALDLKVPYTGATANVDLGEYELKAGQVEFDQTPTGTAGVGVMRWNDADGTLDLGLKGGNVTLQLGQEQVARVVNKSGVNLLESAYQVVKVTDAQGQRLAVDLAQGNNDANSTDTIGIVTENIDNNQEGFITTSGIVRNINTTGSLQGETWNDGDVLYLSPTTAGAITNIKPTAPNHTVILGYVVYAHAVNGKIFTKCDNGYELGELHDCYLPTPSNNDGIFWNSTNLRYENKSVSSALGYTPANAATTLTINGVTYDLSTSRSWTVSAGISGSGASGQVAYWDGTTSQAGSANFTWDNTNGRLGITALVDNATGHRVGLNMTSAAITRMYFDSSATGSSWNAGISISASTVRKWTIAGYGSTFDFTFYNEGLSSPAIFVKGSTNNVILGGSTTDNGQKLQVQGTTLLNGNVTFSSATGMFWDATNSRLGIGTNAPLYNLDVTGGVRIGSGTNGFLFNSNTISTFGNIFLSIQADRVFSITDSSYNNVYFRVVRNTGNTLLGSTTDSGERLQVTGTMKVTGNVAVDTNTLFVDTTNKRIGVRTATPSAGIDVWNNSTTELGQYRLSDSRVTIPNYSSVGFSPALTTNTLSFISAWTSSTGGVQLAGFTSATNTGNPFVFVGYHGGTAPTTAALKFIGFKHDGGTNRTALTGNEIIAGFSAGVSADVFQVKANGRINMSSLPTSSSGLATGDLWNDAGTIKIV